MYTCIYYCVIYPSLVFAEAAAAAVFALAPGTQLVHVGNVGEWGVAQENCKCAGLILKSNWLHEEVVRNQAYKFTNCKKSPWALLRMFSIGVVRKLLPFAWLCYSQVIHHRQIFRFNVDSSYAPIRTIQIARCYSQKLNSRHANSKYLNKYFIADICLYCPTDVQWLHPRQGQI